MIAGAAVGGGGGGAVGGALGGAFSLGEAAYSAQQARAESRKNRLFQFYMSSTAMQRRVTDLKAAGLNPVLAMGGTGGASTPPGSMAQNPYRGGATEGAIKGHAAQAAAKQANAQALQAKQFGDKAGVEAARTEALVPLEKANLEATERQTNSATDLNRIHATSAALGVPERQRDAELYQEGSWLKAMERYGMPAAIGGVSAFALKGLGKLFKGRVKIGTPKGAK